MADEYGHTYGTATQDMPMMPMSADVLNTILQRENIPELLMHKLRGEMWSQKDNKWVPFGKAKMNENGVRDIINFVGNYVGVDKIATDFTEEEIASKMRNFRNRLIDYIAENCDNWEMDENYASSILNMIVDTVHANLTASRNAVLLSFMKPTFRRVETVRPEKKEGGLLSFIPLFNRD